MDNKSIDINQRIPLDTLHVALEAYLNDVYTNEYILEQLRLEYSGENRLKKSLRIVNKIISKSPMIEIIDSRIDEVKQSLKKKTDRNVLLIAMLNAAFPFAADVLQVFGKYFKVQDVINADTVKKTISSTYGGNRATENGIYSVVPMFLEAGLFDRPKQGIYEFSNKLSVSSQVVLDMYKESYRSIIKGPVDEYHLMDPYFNFVKI